jgi:hypothetical protein
MAEIEKLEMDARREQLDADVRGLVDKYRAIFGWLVPDIDEASADGLIIEAVHQSLEAIQRASSDRRRATETQMSSSIVSVR